MASNGAARVGQLPETLSDAISQAISGGGLIPPGTMYVGLTTPLGNAVIDPFAAAQDPATQNVLNALGITVTFGLGTPPPSLTTGPALGENLKTLALVGGGLLLVLLLSRK
jgi:hypothetical protein